MSGRLAGWCGGVDHASDRCGTGDQAGPAEGGQAS